MKFKDDLFIAVKSGDINELSKIEVDVFNGPIGSYGFRSGMWPVKIAGIKFKMFNSVPHELDLISQTERLVNSVLLKIKRAMKGETYFDTVGNECLMYVSQMDRIDG